MSTTLRRWTAGAAFAVTLAASGSIAGCGSADSGSGSSSAGGAAAIASAGATGAPESANLKVGILPTPDYAAAQVAIDKGFFTAEGLTVSTELMSNGNSAPSIVGGSYDIAGMNWISFLVATSKRVPVTAVAEGSLGGPGYAQIMVPADSSVQSLADLDGEKVGVLASPGNCDLLSQQTLKEQNSTAKPAWVTLAVPDMPANLQRGNVAASCVPEPLASSLLAGGKFRSVHDLFTGPTGEQFPVSGFVSSATYVKDNPNTVAAFQRAIQKAADLIRQDPAVLRAALLKYTTLTESQTTSMKLPSYPESVTDFANLEKAGKLLTDLGVAGEVSIPKAQ